MAETGLKDRLGKNIKTGQVVHWTDGGDDLTLEERIAIRWDRIAVVSMEGILPIFSVIDSPSDSVKNSQSGFYRFNYGSFIYKDTENYLTIVADTAYEYWKKFSNAGDCMKYVLEAVAAKEQKEKQYG